MLEGIKTDIEKLIALYEAERSERERLQAELVRCGAENESCRKRIEDLEQQVNNLHRSGRRQFRRQGKDRETYQGD